MGLSAGGEALTFTAAAGAARPARQAQLSKAAYVPIICGLLLLLSICAAAGVLTVLSRHQAGDATHAGQVVAQARTLRELIVAAESSQRGYLLTQQPAYRAPFSRSLDDIAVAEAHLAGLVGKDAAMAPLVRQLHARIAGKVAEMQRTLQLSDSGQLSAARALVGTGVGVRLMDAAKADLAQLQDDMTRARVEAISAQALTASLLVAAIALAALGALLMAGIAVLQVRQHLGLLSQREQELDALVASLEARVAQRTVALAEANQRFQIALDSSEITVFSQDRDLAYGFVSRGTPDTPPEQIIGCTDADILPPESAAAMDRLKRGVVTSGNPARAEMRVDYRAATRWYDMTVVPTYDTLGLVNGIVGGAVDISDRKQNEAHVRLLLREITHRSKNLLAVIQAIMRQTATHATSTADFSKRFSARLDALAGSLDLLVQEDWRGVTLADLVRSQLAHHADGGSSQIELDGGSLKLPPDAAQNIGMALHELATNASKYGALSVPEGRVRVSWQTVPQAKGPPHCILRWEETGGPAVSAPARRGFGQVVIERTVARAVGGEVSLLYPPSGVQWRLEFPLANEMPADDA